MLSYPLLCDAEDAIAVSLSSVSSSVVSSHAFASISKLLIWGGSGFANNQFSIFNRAPFTITPFYLVLLNYKEGNSVILYFDYNVYSPLSMSHAQ